MNAVARARIMAIALGCASCHHEANVPNIPDAAVPRILDAGASNSPRADCARPLADYCGNAPCTTYENEAQRLRALIARYNDSGCLLVAQIGECGSFRVVSQSDGYVGRVTYFDGNGALVGVKASSDTNEYCNGNAFGATYGSVPTCTLKVTQDLCAHAR
jgi:hypothetical protein